jgi:8-oxo-dGTP pyrophosphatase MutT (NUDIX family)
MHLAVQPEIDTGVEQLSVTGVVMSPDEQGYDRVLLGRRSTQTRIYGGMWELGPSGGVDPPPLNRAVLREGDVFAQLQREFAEETGSPSPITRVRLQAICQDLAAHSSDLVFVCRAGPLSPSEEVDPERWEYDRVQWVALRDIPRWTRSTGNRSSHPPGPSFGSLGGFDRRRVRNCCAACSRTASFHDGGDPDDR